MRLLVYAFGPYDGFAVNRSEEILQRLEDRPFVDRHVFPVVFEQDPYLKALNDYFPDLILGLGQQETTPSVRIERRAVNAYQTGPDAPVLPIIEGGQRALPTTLPISAQPGMIYADDAGMHASNYSMYVLLAAGRWRGTRLGFLHLPLESSLQKTLLVVEQVIDRLERTYRARASLASGRRAAEKATEPSGH